MDVHESTDYIRDWPGASYHVWLCDACKSRSVVRSLWCDHENDGKDLDAVVTCPACGERTRRHGSFCASGRGGKGAKMVRLPLEETDPP
jgi:hypothetical protein